MCIMYGLEGILTACQLAKSFLPSNEMAGMWTWARPQTSLRITAEQSPMRLSLRVKAASAAEYLQ